MPSVMIDVDYDHWEEERNITERTTKNLKNSTETAEMAILLLDEAYGRARARLIEQLPSAAQKRVPVMVPVPEDLVPQLKEDLKRARG